MTQNILLSGTILMADRDLISLLEKKYQLYLADTKNRAELTCSEENISLVVFELSDEWKREIKFLQHLKWKQNELKVIVLNGDDSQNLVIQSFQANFEDYFKKPYQASLLAERIEALLNIPLKSSIF